MTSLESARSLILSTVSAVDSERVSLTDAGGRVVSEDVRAPIPLPPTRVAVVGGFLCRRDAVVPQSFPLDGCLPTDEPPAGDSAISPGDLVPADAVAVVSSRALAAAGQTDGGDSIAEPGMFAASGDIVIPRGKPLSAVDVRLLGELGVRRVAVHRKPRIGIVAIGDELARVDEALAPGKRYDGASPMLAAHVVDCGGIPVQLGPVPLSREDIEFAMSKAAEETDALILTAASGAVPDDELHQILVKKGVEQRFLGLALSPGCATFFGTARGRPVLLVPSATADLLATSEFLITPLIHKLAGLALTEPRKVGALLEQTLRCPAQGVCTVWAVELKMDDKPIIARPVKGWPGGVVFNAASVHGLCMSADGHDIRAGYSVEVVPVRTASR